MLLYRRDLPSSQWAPLALFSATALPLVVVITSIGTSTGRMRPENAAALVGAGMLSVLIYPLIGFTLLRRSGAIGAPADQTDDGMTGDDAGTSAPVTPAPDAS